MGNSAQRFKKIFAFEVDLVFDDFQSRFVDKAESLWTSEHDIWLVALFRAIFNDSELDFDVDMHRNLPAGGLFVSVSILGFKTRKLARQSRRSWNKKTLRESIISTKINKNADATERNENKNISNVRVLNISNVHEIVCAKNRLKRLQDVDRESKESNAHKHAEPALDEPALDEKVYQFFSHTESELRRHEELSLLNVGSRSILDQPSNILIASNHVSHDHFDRSSIPKENQLQPELSCSRRATLFFIDVPEGEEGLSLLEASAQVLFCTVHQSQAPDVFTFCLSSSYDHAAYIDSCLPEHRPFLEIHLHAVASSVGRKMEGKHHSHDQVPVLRHQSLLQEHSALQTAYKELLLKCENAEAELASRHQESQVYEVNGRRASNVEKSHASDAKSRLLSTLEVSPEIEVVADLKKQPREFLSDTGKAVNLNKLSSAVVENVESFDYERKEEHKNANSLLRVNLLPDDELSRIKSALQALQIEHADLIALHSRLQAVKDEVEKKSISLEEQLAASVACCKDLAVQHVADRELEVCQLFVAAQYVLVIFRSENVRLNSQIYRLGRPS